jgi:hypothetical protein
LLDLAKKREAEATEAMAAQVAAAQAEVEGDGLVRVGYAQVSLGNLEAGLKLIEQGIAKGKLKRPDDARLRLGMAQLQSPKTRAAAVQTLRSVRGTDGSAEIARLWTVLGNP